MRRYLARRRVNAACLPPNTQAVSTLQNEVNQLSDYASTLETLKSQAQSYLNDASNGITRRTLAHWEGEYPQFNRADFIYLDPKYYRTEFLSDTISLINELITATNQTKAQKSSELGAAQAQLASMQDLYAICLEGVSASEAGAALAMQQPQPAAPAPTGTAQLTKYLPYLLAGGVGLYFLTRKKKR